MSSQASSAGHGEKEVRQKIIETGDVDVMISIRSNFFYTRTVPCELWFFDRAKPAECKDKVLMLDARNVYRKVTRKIYDFSPEQMRNLAAIVWLYRGEQKRFLLLAKDYIRRICAESKAVPVALAAFEATLMDVRGRLDRLADIVAKHVEIDAEKKQPLADAAIELQEAARQLYREWIVRLRFPGYEHTRITNGVPEGWERKRLGNLCKEIRESVLPQGLEPDTPYIGLEHMPRRSISLGEWGKAQQVISSKHRFSAGEILFGKIRPYFHKVGIAFIDGVASSDVIVIRPLEDKLRGLVLMTVSSDEFVAVTAQTMKEGSKMPRADWKQMQQYLVLLPPDGLLNSFENVIQPLVDQLKTLSFANQKLRAVRDLLLPRLMSGEITI
jgi:hypothetical protein